jgi:GNAT superfamily N-acetyltransferase
VSDLRGPVPIDKSYEVAAFDCGRAPLNIFLARHAQGNQANNSARTFVVLDEQRVVGYYSLAASAVLYDEAPERMAKGLARHPIPVILMARFAVDLAYQGRGVGRAMFKDAILRSLGVSADIGARAFVVHAKDDNAKALYMHLEMQPFPSNPLHLFLLMKDIEKALR